MPFYADSDPASAWALSEIALRKSLVDDVVVSMELMPALTRLRAGWPKWQQDIPVLVMTPDGSGGETTICLRGVDPVHLRYLKSQGLFLNHA